MWTFKQWILYIHKKSPDSIMHACLLFLCRAKASGLTACLWSHWTKFRIFPSDLKSDSVVTIKEEVFEIFSESLNLIVSFMAVVVNKQNSVLHPCLPSDQRCAQKMLPTELRSLVCVQPHLRYLPALLADVVLHAKNWPFLCRLPLKWSAQHALSSASSKEKKGAPDKCLIHTLGMNNA